MPVSRRFFTLAATLLLGLVFIIFLLGGLGVQASAAAVAPGAALAQTAPPPALQFGPPLDLPAEPKAALMAPPAVPLALPQADRLPALLDAAPRPLPTQGDSPFALDEANAPDSPNAIFTVINLNDSGAGSLRDAVAQANAAAGFDQIQFNLSGCPCTITLISQIATSGQLAITGPGANLLTLSGNNTNRIFDASAANSPLELSGLTLANGVSAGVNGGAVIAGNLTLTSVVVRNSSATSGGGVFTSGNLTLNNVTFDSNTATTNVGGGAQVSMQLIATGVTFQNNTAYADGGGAYVNGNATISNSRFELNETTEVKGYGGGGGLMVFGISIINSTQFINNTTPAWGGGAYLANFTAGTTNLLTDVDFSGNTCVYGGGGLFQWFNATFTNVDFVNNQAGLAGGGVYAGYAGNHTIRFDGGLIQGNTANTGGGLYSDSSFTLSGLLIDGNTALNGRGGGASSQVSAFVSNSTLSSNTSVTGGNGGGLFAGASVIITDTQFILNTIQGNSNGGGLAVGTTQGAGSASLLRVALDRNSTASGFGGGLFSYGATKITDSYFYDNTSGDDGGGAWVGSTLTLTGGLFQGNRTFLNQNNGGGGGLMSHVQASIDGTQFIDNTSADWGGGVYLYNYGPGSSQLTDVIFDSNEATAGGGGGAFAWFTTTLSAPVFFDNYAGWRGGGLYSSYAGNYPLNLKGGYFQGNSGMGGGGVFSEADIVINTTEFYTNTSRSGNGGGAWTTQSARVEASYFEGNTVLTGGNSGGLDTAGHVWMTDTVFLRNRTLTGGGGGSGAGGNASVLRGEYIQNDAADDGGGMLVFGTATVKQSTFETNTTGDLGGGMAVGILDGQALYLIGNNATGSGGGLFINTSFNLSGSTIINNQAQNSGGGMLMGGSGAGIVATTLISGNQAGLTGSGGGLYSNSTALAVTNSTFVSNSAGDQGGGLHAAQADVDTSSFVNNSAGSRGGGLNLWAGTNSIRRTDFSDNQGAAGGGLALQGSAGGLLENSLLVQNTASGGSGQALLIDSSAAFEIRHATIANPSQAAGSAIYLNAGALTVQNTILANHGVGLARIGGSATLNNSLLHGNGANSQGTGTNFNGSVNGSPAFASPATGDYHLSVGSLAFNAGLNLGVTVDYDGDVRPQGGGVDIGFDEALTPTGINFTHTAPRPAGQAVQFSGSANFGQGITYTWDFGDGGSAVGQTVNHAYAQPGTYTVELTAANAAGQNVTSQDVDITNANLFLPLIQR